MIDRSRIRPSLWWLGLAGAVVVAGIAGAVLLLVVTLKDVTGSFTPLNGPATVRLHEGDGRGIWTYTSEPVSGFCSATGPARVEMQRTTGVTVTTGGREYHSFLRFEAPRTGAYHVSCATSRPVALGPSVTGLRLFAGVAGVLGSFFGGLFLAALIVALVLILRERSKRRLEMEARGG
ncbi:MAG: hypothetical protein QOI91_735 [Solirubrobacteraceae bacterium]|nr:hypothetical protein [Solirubrobacteraceae bacterium]